MGVVSYDKTYSRYRSKSPDLVRIIFVSQMNESLNTPCTRFSYSGRIALLGGHAFVESLGICSACTEPRIARFCSKLTNISTQL